MYEIITEAEITTIASISAVVTIAVFLACVAAAVIENQRRERAEMRRLERQLQEMLDRVEREDS